jgi:hypothetical protein
MEGNGEREAESLPDIKISAAVNLGEVGVGHALRYIGRASSCELLEGSCWKGYYCGDEQCHCLQYDGDLYIECHSLR